VQSTSPHILVACHAWYGDTIGGSFRLASEFAEFLAANGHKVSYLCCASSPQWKGPLQEVINGVSVFRYMPPASTTSGFGRMQFHVKHTKRLARSIHAECPVNALSGHSPLQALGAAQALQRFNTIFSNYTVHSPFDDELRSNTGRSLPRLMNRLAALAARRIDSKNCQLADRVQCDSQYTLSVMRAKHARKIGQKGIVAPGWVDVSQFLPANNRRELRNSLGEPWQTDSPVFFTLRRLENRMGLETLVEACRKLHDEGLKFRTLIGGGGSLKESLQRMIDVAGISDSVQLLGRLPEADLAKCYAAADCFVLPTRALECFGLIVLEAFACNTPVIASNAAAIPELAEQQGKDWMFEAGDVEQLTGRIQNFIEGRLKPTVNLRDIALKYDKPNVLDQWKRLLLERLEDR
jgi:glycosyltransferase involved in cell wall biosynthesis